MGTTAKVLLGVTAGVLILCGIGTTIAMVATAGGPKPAPSYSSVFGANPTITAGAAPAAEPTTQPPTQAAPTQAPAKPTITDGTWTVGEDLPAGNYRTTGSGENCYWSITKSGTNGADIIDNHIGGGNLRVTLKAGQDFETKRCGTWTKV